MPNTRLTKREQDVLQSLMKGYDNKRIARELHISSGTVKLHLHAIYTKMGARGRLHLLSMTYPRTETTTYEQT